MNIHILSNNPEMNSGYGNVTKNIAIGLKKRGYNVTVTGMQHAYMSKWSFGIEVLPIDTQYVDEVTQYMMNLQNTKTDVAINIFQSDADLNHLPKVFPKTIFYTTIEGSRVPSVSLKDFIDIIRQGGKIIVPTMFAKKEIEVCGLEDISMIPYGYNDDVFKPIDLKNEKYMKYCFYKTDIGKNMSDPELLHMMGCYDCKLGLGDQQNCEFFKEEIVSIMKWMNTDTGERWIKRDIPISEFKNEFKGKFMYLCVAQNFGVRKRYERLLRAYSILINESKQLRDRTVLHLHCMPIAINGMNLIEEIALLGIQNNVSFSYGNFRSNTWSENAMNVLYNISDCFTTASSGEGFCVLPECSILTLNRGVQKIKDIKTGDYVLTHKGRFRKVSKVMKRYYEGDLLKIVPDKISIPIFLTHEHKVLYANIDTCEECGKHNTEWVSAQSLQIGDFVTYPRIQEIDVDIEKIKISDYLDNPGTVTEDNYDIIPEIEVNEDFMRLCGYFISTGYIYHYADYDRNGMSDDSIIKFEFHMKENRYIEDVENIMKNIFGLSCRHNVDKRSMSHSLTFKNRAVAKLFRNMLYTHDIISYTHDITSTSERKEICPELINLPRYKLVELIKGIWRGNKNRVNGIFSISNICETIAWQLMYILSKFNILAGINIIDTDRNRSKDALCNYVVQVSGKDAILFEDMVDEEYVHNKDIDGQSQEYIKENDMYLVPIKDIGKVSYEGYVYNLEVEEDNSYVSSISIHNCLPALESMATGTPVIAPKFTSFPELIGDGNGPNPRGLLAELSDIQMTQTTSYKCLVNEKDLALKMKTMYVKNDKRKEYSKNCLKFVKNYTWDKICNEWDDLLKHY